MKVIHRMKASFSVFLALVFVILTSFIITLINGVRVSSCIATINMINNMGMTSAFAEYDRDLFEEFGLLMIEGTKESLSDTLTEYIDANTRYDAALLNVSLARLDVRTCYRPMSGKGELLEKQVVDYMKYAAPVGIGSDIIKEMLGYEEDNPTKKVTDNVIELTGDVETFSQDMYELMSYIDGVKVEGTFIENDGSIVYSNESFVKMISPQKDSIRMGINSQYILFSIIDKVYDPRSDLLKIKYLYEEYMISKDEELYNEMVIIRERLFEQVESALEYYEKAINKANIIRTRADSINIVVNNTDNMLETYKDRIDKELYEGLKKELGNYKDMDTEAVNEMCDIDTLTDALERNESLLQEVMLLKKYDVRTQSSMESDYARKLEEAAIMFNTFSVADICIDYTNVEIFRKKNRSNILEELKSIYDEGVLGIVMMDKEVSTKSVPAQYEITVKGDYPFEGVEYLTRNTMFNEYCLSKFTSATDEAVGNHLDYEMEYILQGKLSDKENLGATIEDIILIREGINFAYLITDSEKSAAAYELATTLVAGAGIPGLVTLTKFVILAIWAYGESIVDAKILLDGERMSFLKTKDSWNLSFEKLLELDLAGEKKDESKIGLAYEDYVRYLLYTSDYCGKNKALANLIEMHMINKGNVNFDMEKMIVAADVNAVYRYNNNSEYIKKSTFAY